MKEKEKVLRYHTLGQNYFLSDGTGDKAEDNPIWQIPLLFASNKTIVPKVCEMMTEKRQSFTVDFGTSKKEEQWVKIQDADEYEFVNER